MVIYIEQHPKRKQ